MRASELPSKLFFRIGEVASLVGVEPHVLRYWEREFRSIRPTKSAKGQRVYSRKDVENLLRVRDLLYRDGFTIAGAKKRLQRAPTATATATTATPPHAARAVQAPLFPEEVGTDDAVAEDSEADLEPDARDVDHANARERDEGDEGDEGGRNENGADPIREKLTALRSEIEGFLFELETGTQLETQLETERSDLGDRA